MIFTGGWLMNYFLFYTKGESGQVGKMLKGSYKTS